MFRSFFIFWLSAVFALPVLADRQITDQLNRTVTIPDEIHRAVILQHQTLNIAVQLDATSQIAGIISNWEKLLGKGYARLAPALTKLPEVGDLKTVNLESLLVLKPDVVFVTNYFPQEQIDKMTNMGLPVIAVSLRRSDGTEAAKLNPTLSDEDSAYNEGLKDGIGIIAEVFNKQEQGKNLIKAAFANRPLLKARLQNIKSEQRVRSYIANPNLETYGSGKYTGLMMEHAGAYNVAADSIKGFQQVSMESVLNWNPQVIFIQHRYPQLVEEIKKFSAMAAYKCGQKSARSVNAGIRQILGVSYAGSHCPG